MLPYMVTCHDLTKVYAAGRQRVAALRGVDLLVGRGELLAIVGPSGSGKSTLLNVLACLDAATAGEVLVGGYDLARLTDAETARYRGVMVGYLWQQVGRNLIPDRTLAHNVELPQLLNGIGRSLRIRRTCELLHAIGLRDKATRFPAQLSGGEQQRAALAVALANHPPLLLADEPTGELDAATAQEVITFLHRLARDHGTTVIVATHDTAVAQAATRTLLLRDGQRVMSPSEARFPVREAPVASHAQWQDATVAPPDGSQQ